ncbi:UNVERIFIED_CONTAM: hypothetical protein Slati_2141900 [Sesamum latifolium]|uniref:Integrase catalytic domain-containing protein n=1 Tax=Sesamum latifolium TaxID=2727402 RepID=A0AAW2WQU6_9LAMI
MEAARLKTRATRFIMQEHILYKKSYMHPLLRCLSTEEGIHILQEIHSGCCGAPHSTRILANKPFGQVLLANHEARCDSISKQVREVPKAFLSHTSASRTPHYDVVPCPFIQWGIDIVGPFPLAMGQRKFLLVAIDYFTKWVEAEPLARIPEGEVMKFIWKNIGIKRRLERVGENWAEELTSVLWAYRTTPRGSTGESPFSLVYGTEAIIPAELGIPLIGS